MICLWKEPEPHKLPFRVAFVFPGIQCAWCCVFITLFVCTLAVPTLLADWSACSLQREKDFCFFSILFFCTYDCCFLVSHICSIAGGGDLFYPLVLQEVIGKQGMHLLCSVKLVTGIRWEVCSQEFCRRSPCVNVWNSGIIHSWIICTLAIQ